MFAFQVLGKVGKIVKIDSDGDVAVVFGQKAVVLNPACCSPAPGCRPDEIGGSVDKGSSDADGIVIHIIIVTTFLISHSFNTNHT